MPDPTKAFGVQLPLAFGGEHPPVDQARLLMGELYFVDRVSVINKEPVFDSRGGYSFKEVTREDIPAHVTKVSNQRGAFTQGSTSSSGHGPLTSASLWYAFFPMGTLIGIGDVLVLKDGGKLAVIGRADEASWRVMEAYRCTELGLNQ